MTYKTGYFAIFLLYQLLFDENHADVFSIQYSSAELCHKAIATKRNNMLAAT